MSVNSFPVLHSAPAFAHVHPRASPADTCSIDFLAPACVSAGVHPLARARKLVQVTANLAEDALESGRREAAELAQRLAAEVATEFQGAPEFASVAEQNALRDAAAAVVAKAGDRLNRARADRAAAIAAYQSPDYLSAELTAATHELDMARQQQAAADKALAAATAALAQARARIAERIARNLRAELESRRVEVMARAAAIAAELGCEAVLLAEAEQAFRAAVDGPTRPRASGM